MSKKVGNDRRKMARAQRNVEDLAVRCLGSAVSAVMVDSGGVYSDEDVQWERAGSVAVEMAVHIRLHSSRRIAELFNSDEGRLELDDEALAAIKRFREGSRLQIKAPRRSGKARAAALQALACAASGGSVLWSCRDGLASAALIADEARRHGWPTIDDKADAAVVRFGMGRIRCVES